MNAYELRVSQIHACEGRWIQTNDMNGKNAILPL